MPSFPTDRDPAAPLGAHLFEILLALASGPAHGYGIISDIRARTEDRVVLSTSTLYRGIERLLAQGLIAEAGEQPGEHSGGPPRRYYQITDRGRSSAQVEAQRLRDAIKVADERMLITPPRSQS